MCIWVVDPSGRVSSSRTKISQDTTSTCSQISRGTLRSAALTKCSGTLWTGGHTGARVSDPSGAQGRTWCRHRPCPGPDSGPVLWASLSPLCGGHGATLATNPGQGTGRGSNWRRTAKSITVPPARNSIGVTKKAGTVRHWEGPALLTETQRKAGLNRGVVGPGPHREGAPAACPHLCGHWPL